MKTIVIKPEGGWSHGFPDFDAYFAHVAYVCFCGNGNAADVVHLNLMQDALEGFFAL